MSEETTSGTDGEVPEEYAMDDGHRPDRIRRRNRITGLALALLIAIFVAITIYTRWSDEDNTYNDVGEPADGLGPAKQRPLEEGPSEPPNP